jgi:hypothetical protein
VFTDPLPSNRRLIVTLVGSRGNMFTESLPSNWSLRHTMLGYVYNNIATLHSELASGDTSI